MFLLQRYDTDCKKWVTISTHKWDVDAKAAFDDYVAEIARDKLKVRVYVDPDDDGRGWSVESYTPTRRRTGKV